MTNSGIAYPKNFIRYLGTAGTRFVMLTQMRASGGMWFSYGGCRGVIDPGPGSLVQICAAKPRLDPFNTEAIILTHRHVDHSTDVNVLAEAMTHGGFEKRGSVVLPKDAHSDHDSVLLDYIASRVEKLSIANDNGVIELAGGVTIEPVPHKHHKVDCYGYVFRAPGLPTWGVIADTSPLLEFADRYAECEFLSVNMTIPMPRGGLDHFSVPDVHSLLAKISPKLVALTHLGRVLLTELDVTGIARWLSTERSKVAAATDGMLVDLSSLERFDEPL